MGMREYQCIRPCFFQGRLWEIGQVARFEDGEWPKDKDGKMRHFVPISKSEPVSPAPVDVEQPSNKEDDEPLFPRKVRKKKPE